jgi:hypothetical protein
MKTSKRRMKGKPEEEEEKEEQPELWKKTFKGV